MSAPFFNFERPAGADESEATTQEKIDDRKASHTDLAVVFGIVGCSDSAFSDHRVNIDLRADGKAAVVYRVGAGDIPTALTSQLTYQLIRGESAYAPASSLSKDTDVVERQYKPGDYCFATETGQISFSQELSLKPTLTLSLPPA